MTTKSRLDGTMEWTGHWWLPEDSLNTVPGILSYNPEEGLKLSLIGGFQDPSNRKLDSGGIRITGGTGRWPTIHGLAENKRITILDCIQVSSKSYGLNVPSHPDKQIISASSALVGVHLSDCEDEVFTSVSVSVENMNTWASSTPLKGVVGMKNERPNGHGTISAHPVEKQAVTVDGTTITLCHNYTFPYIENTRGQTIGRIRDTVFVGFQPPGPISLTKAIQLVKPIQDLVSLAMHRASALLSLQLHMPSGTHDQPTGYPACDRKIDAYFKDTLVGNGDVRAISPKDALFTCEDIPFVEIIPRWWQVREQFLASSNMVLGLRYAPARYVEGNLLTAVGAAEAMHRALDKNKTFLPPEEFKELRETLLEHVPQQHRSWVRGLVRNSPTLDDRLRDLAQQPDGEAMRNLVPDVDRWAKIATRARNDLAHEGQSPRQSIDELVTTVKVTSAVVVMNLLQALGIPPERQREVVYCQPELHQTAIQAKLHLDV